MTIHFRLLSLAPQAWDILGYPLVCKTHWMCARVISFPAWGGGGRGHPPEIVGSASCTVKCYTVFIYVLTLSDMFGLKGSLVVVNLSSGLSSSAG